MAYSTIIKKKCKGGCGKFPVLGLNGYCYTCAPAELLVKVGDKKKLQIKNQNARKLQSVKLRTLVVEMDNKKLWEKKQLDLWFENRRKELTGKCLLCGCRTEKYNEETYKRSIAHLLAKRKNMFPSIAIHPKNVIELCFFYNSCHTNFDNGIITLDSIKKYKPLAWEVIVRKFKILYPCIAENERKNIPEILLDTLDPHISEISKTEYTKD